MAVALLYREKWGAQIPPEFANDLGARVLTGPRSKVGGYGVVTSIDELRQALLEPLGPPADGPMNA